MRHFRIYAGALAFLALGTLPAAAVTPVDPANLKFEVSLNDKPIGHHALAFSRRDNGKLDVTIDIDLEVKFGPFKVFDYEHRNESVWRDGLLHSMRSVTDDNGEHHEVMADGDTNRLQVLTDSVDSYYTDIRTLPTTYWMVSTVAQDRLINSQTGELLEVEVTEVGREDVPGPNGPISATHYRMTGDLEIDLWYDDAGILVGLAFEAGGRDITYRLIARDGLLPVAAAMPRLTARK